jgi:DNA-binding CsgD family transcriptional regulator
MLLGREREREAIGRLISDARDGRSGVLALVGEAGIGKSALLGAAATAATGMHVLRARGVASEAHIPFAGLFELLRPALDCLNALPRPQASALESALALRPAQAEDRFAVGAATLSLLGAYAESRPVALLVDDVQWLDGSSADALLFAVRRLLAEPIVVLLAAREGEPSLLDGAGLPTLQVEGLDPEAAAALLADVGPELAARLHRETGGNPLALLELARGQLSDLAPDVPVPVVTSVAQTFVDRAAALPDRTQRMLVLAAATDRGELAVLARAASALGLEVLDLAPAEETHLVAIDGARLEFRHPLARSAIYASAAPERRRAAHRALADALPDADADRRAWHLALAAAGPDETACSALEQAAERARERTAYGVASRAFERAALLAAADDRRAGLFFAAADAAWLGGLAERAGSLLADAARVAVDAPLALRIDHLRGHIAVHRGPLDEGRALLVAAAERANSSEAVEMLAEAAIGAFYAADAVGVRACGDRASELVTRDSDTRTAFFGRMAEGMGLVLSGAGDRGSEAIREAVSLVDGTDEFGTDPRLLAWAVLGPLWLREAGVGRELVERTVATARERSAVGVLPQLLAYASLQQAQAGRWVEAQAGYDEAIRLARETGQRVVLSAALALTAKLEALVGREEATRAHAAEALAIARGRGVVLCEIWSLAALRDLELGLGHLDAALARIDEQQAVIDRQGIADVDLFSTPERVELYLRLGRVEEATGEAAAFERAARAKGQPWSLARAARSRGLVADGEDFERCFEEALSLHASTPDVFELARTELAYGSRLRRAGRRVQAREWLRAAIASFDDFGAAPWADIASSELAATGETARRRTPSSLDELTPQELQISVLLAQGRTTREAAAALFLSPKTIEYHLRNAYRKLAIHSRDELRDALQSRREPD